MLPTVANGYTVTVKIGKSLITVIISPPKPALNRDDSQKLSTGNNQDNEVIHRMKGTNEGLVTSNK